MTKNESCVALFWRKPAKINIISHRIDTNRHISFTGQLGGLVYAFIILEYCYYDEKILKLIIIAGAA